MRAHSAALHLTRRDFLRAAGLAAGGFAALRAFAATGQAGAGLAAPGVPPLRVGVLLPRSSLYPGLAESLAGGLRLGLAAGPAVELAHADIDVGQGLVRRAAGDLLDGGARLLVGLAPAGAAFALHDLLAEGRVLLVAAGAGENVARAGEASPFVFRHSLALWQASWALGDWAARHLGRRAALAASFHDSGFDALYAFRLGFEGAGGEVLLTHVTHLPPEMGPAASLVAPLVAARPDVVFAAYGGPDAVEFVRAYAGSALAGRAPLLGAGFLTDEAILTDHGPAALGVLTAAPWAAGLDSAADRAFRAAYAARAGRQPDAFALLGYETGRLVAGALAVAGADADVAALRAALAEASFAGPRGVVAMDARTQAVAGPLYLREVRSSAGALANIAVASLPAIDELDARLAPLRAAVKTGWVNGYLCV